MKVKDLVKYDREVPGGYDCRCCEQFTFDLTRDFCLCDFTTTPGGIIRCLTHDQRMEA